MIVEMKVSRKSWHYRFMKWMWGDTDEDNEELRTIEYWTIIVVTFFIIPLLGAYAIIRAFAKGVEKIVDFIESVDKKVEFVD